MTDSYPTTKKVELSFSQAAAVNGTWYTAFEGTDVEFNCFAVGVTVANETLEIQVTIDGVTLASAAGVACTFAANPYSNLPNTIVHTTGTGVFTQGAAAAAVTSTDTGLRWLRGHDVKVEVRKSTAAGASAVTGKGAYFKLK